MAESNFTRVRVAHSVEKSEEERKHLLKKKILILIHSFLEKQGYSGSAAYLNSEIGFNINQFVVCDNMDLEIILQEFETFYSMKFGKNAQIFKKVDGNKASEKAQKVKPHRLKGPLTITLSQTTEAPKSMRTSYEGGHGVDILQPLGPYANLNLDNEYRILAGLVVQEMLVNHPNVHWDDVIGHIEAKNILKESLIYPIKYPELYSLVDLWKGLLLFGPTGTGKTMLAKAVATECQATFFNVSAASFTSKWRGESEKLIKVLFELAQYHSPSIIFLDEVDAIMSLRNITDHEASRRFKSEMLAQMDGLTTGGKSAFVLAASNSPWELDPAFLRRMECRQYISPPDYSAVKELFTKYLPSSIKYLTYTIPVDVNNEHCAEKCLGYTGADIALICKKVKLEAIRGLVNYLESENCKPQKVFSLITSENILSVIETMKPMQQTILNRYKNFANGVIGT